MASPWRAAVCWIVVLLSLGEAKRVAKGGRGFGASGRGFSSNRKPARSAKQSRPPAAKQAVPPAAKPRGGLETTLLEQHAENCRASADRWATCTHDDMPGQYEGGWHSLSSAPPIAPENNQPYGTDRLILKSRAPLLSEEECAALIEQMETHGAANGWDARYPVAGFTREVNIADIPASVELLNGALQSTLLPAAASEFPAFEASSLRVNEALIVKYDADSGANCLPVHEDFSFVTINVRATHIRTRPRPLDTGLRLLRFSRARCRTGGAE